LKLAGKKPLKAQKFDLLFTQDRIARRIKQLGQEISRDYRDKELVVIGVLKGCVIFLADLARQINIPIQLEFISASSYSNGRIPEDKVIMAGGPDVSLAGRHLLIVEGVVDSGHTIAALIERMKLLEPASIEVVTLLDKSECRQVDVKIKYKGFDVGGDFVIGFGLDESQKYRNLPFIGKVLND